MQHYRQYVQQTMPNTTIRSYKQNDNGWDNIVVIVNNEWLFRFPRKSQYARRIPREKKVCEILSHSLQGIEVPKYHVLYKNESDSIPFGSYYALIHGEPLTAQTLAGLTVKEQEIIATQLATFLSSLHTIPIERAVEWGFHVERHLTYWRQIQAKLHDYLSHTFTSIERKSFDCLFENFFEYIHEPNFQNTMIHADFTHHHILFNGKNKKVSGIIDFGDTQIGDPAFDFAGLYHDFGNEFTGAIYKQYCALTPHHDSSFTQRITSFYQYSPLFHNLIYSFETNNKLEINKNLESMHTILKGLN